MSLTGVSWGKLSEIGVSDAGLRVGGWALVMLLLARRLTSSMEFLSFARAASWAREMAFPSSTPAYWFVGSSFTVSCSSMAASWDRRRRSLFCASLAATRSVFPFSKWTREASSLARCSEMRKRVFDGSRASAFSYCWTALSQSLISSARRACWYALYVVQEASGTRRNRAAVAIFSRFMCLSSLPLGLVSCDAPGAETSLVAAAARYGASGMRRVSSGGKPTKLISTDSMPMLRSTKRFWITSPTRALMISSFPENVAIGFCAEPNVPMYLYGKSGGTGFGGGGEIGRAH